MKTIKLVIAGMVLILSGALQTTQAQVSVTVGTPPPWGPAEAPGIRFYYLPDIEVYFDVNTGEYVYLSGGKDRPRTMECPLDRGSAADLFRRYVPGQLLDGLEAGRGLL